MATFVLAVSARPQDYDDYDQPAQKPATRNQPQKNNQKKSQIDDRETSTFIPIIQYDKQQGTDGSYKTQ